MESSQVNQVPPSSRFSEILGFKEPSRRKSSQQRRFQRLIASCESLRNRALVHVLYESGARAGEILSLKVGDVQFDRLGATVVVKGKTGMRRIRLIESVPDIQRWIAVHPNRNNPEAPLFPSKGGERPLTVEALKPAT